MTIKTQYHGHHKHLYKKINQKMMEINKIDFGHGNKIQNKIMIINNQMIKLI
jgi:hypothetical protein